MVVDEVNSQSRGVIHDVLMCFAVDGSLVKTDSVYGGITVLFKFKIAYLVTHTSVMGKYQIVDGVNDLDRRSIHTIRTLSPCPCSVQSFRHRRGRPLVYGAYNTLPPKSASATCVS